MGQEPLQQHIFPATLALDLHRWRHGGGGGHQLGELAGRAAKTEIQALPGAGLEFGLVESGCHVRRILRAVEEVSQCHLAGEIGEGGKGRRLGLGELAGQVVARVARQ